MKMPRMKRLPIPQKIIDSKVGEESAGIELYFGTIVDEFTHDPNFLKRWMDHLGEDSGRISSVTERARNTLKFLLGEDHHGEIAIPEGQEMSELEAMRRWDDSRSLGRILTSFRKFVKLMVVESLPQLVASLSPSIDGSDFPPEEVERKINEWATTVNLLIVNALFLEPLKEKNPQE